MKQNRKQKIPQDYDAKLLCRRYGLTPLQHMLTVMCDDSLPLQLRSDMAKAAAPYVHRKLIAVDGFDPPVQHSIDISKFDDHELGIFERLVAKAQVRISTTEPEGDSR